MNDRPKDPLIPAKRRSRRAFSPARITRRKLDPARWDKEQERRIGATWKILVENAPLGIFRDGLLEPYANTPLDYTSGQREFTGWDDLRRFLTVYFGR